VLYLLSLRHWTLRRRWLACVPFWPVACGLYLATAVDAGAADDAPPPPATYKKLSLEELMDVEVTSVSRHSERLAEAPSAIQVVTQDEIRRSGATSLPEALRLASNLEVAQADARTWSISARGFGNTLADKMLVMIDGRTVYTPLYAGVFWDAQDVFLPDLDRIEVISGPGATLWGSNAVNGVISITSKNSRDTQGLYVEGGGGSELRAIEGVRYGGELRPDLHYRVYEKYSFHDDSVLPDGSDATNRWQLGQAGFRTDWDASAVDLLTLQGDLYEGRIAQPGTDDVAINGDNVIGRWSHRIADDSDLKVQLYYDRTYRNIPDSITEHLHTYDGDFQYRLPFGPRNDVVWGLGYRVIRDDIANPPTLAILPAQVTRQWFSGFAQDEIAVAKDLLSLTLGSKFEHNEYTGFEVEPSARLAWKVDARQTAWGAVSRAVRTPSRIDTEFYAPRDPPFTLLQGDPDFRSEKLVAYELGYRVQPEQSLSLSLSTFYDDYRDVRSVELVNPPAPFPFTLGNGLEGESYGAELAAECQVMEGWRLRGGYTEMRVHLRAKPGSTDSSQGGTESHDPEHQFSLRSSHDLPGHWECDAAFRYVSAIINQAVPPYAELDLRLAWLPTPDLELSIVGQNLLHEHHAEFGPTTTRQEVERGVYGKVVWRH
jgi:iron complex outermembrane receptor protein